MATCSNKTLILDASFPLYMNNMFHSLLPDWCLLLVVLCIIVEIAAVDLLFAQVDIDELVSRKDTTRRSTE